MVWDDGYFSRVGEMMHICMYVHVLCTSVDRLVREREEGENAFLRGELEIVNIVHGYRMALVAWKR